MDLTPATSRSAVLRLIVELTVVCNSKPTRWNYLEVESWPLDLFVVRLQSFISHPSSLFSFFRLFRMNKLLGWVLKTFQPNSLIAYICKFVCSIWLWNIHKLNTSRPRTEVGKEKILIMHFLVKHPVLMTWDQVKKAFCLANGKVHKFFQFV